MKIIDVLGKPCPAPVIETKKALAEQDVDGVVVKADNMAAVQNLERMAKSYGYGFSCTEKAKGIFEIVISKDGKAPPEVKGGVPEAPQGGAASSGLAVVISRDTMGEGAEELGRILIKGFIYSLTELTVPPRFIIFLNSGVRLTSDGANTVGDLKNLEQKGAEILSCGTCVNYYGLHDKPAVGAIANMYGITERMADASKVINI